MSSQQPDLHFKTADLHRYTASNQTAICESVIHVSSMSAEVICLKKTFVFSRSQTVVRDQHSGHHHDRGPHPLFCSLIPVSLTVRTEGQMDGKTQEEGHDSSPFLHNEEKQLTTCQKECLAVILLLFMKEPAADYQHTHTQKTPSW